MTKGWCPVHDRVVEGRDGACPECGTPLVDLTARPRDEGEPRIVVEEEPEPEPVAAELPAATETSLWPEIALPQRLFGRDTVSIGAPVIAAMLIAAVVASFLVGLAIPRGRGGVGDPSADSTPSVRHDRLVRLERTGAGVRLILDRFSQRGGRVVLRVRVPDQPGIEIGRITSVDAEPIVQGDVALEGVSLDVRNTVTGFIAEGALSPRTDLAITGVRIVSMTMIRNGSGQAALDVSRVWSDRRMGPVASDRVVRLNVRGRDLRVVGMVGWPERLEIRVEERGGPSEWTYHDQYRLLFGEAPPADGEQVGEVVLGESRFVTASFQECGVFPERCLPRGISRVTLTVESQSLAINGNWQWQFT